MSTIRTHGIALLKKEIRENDRIYIIYTSDLGKIEAVARGSRKILSKLAPHLEPPVSSDLMIAKGKHLDKIAGADEINAYPKIKADLERIQLVFSILNQLNRLTKFNSRDQKIWLLVEKFMGICENTPKSVLAESKEILECSFLIKLLAFLGYRPELKKCIFCGRENLRGTLPVIPSEAVVELKDPSEIVETIPPLASRLGRNDNDKWFFDFSKGGIFCESCCAKNFHSGEIQKPVSTLFLEEMNFLLYKRFNDILENCSFKTISKDTKETISSLVENYKV